MLKSEGRVLVNHHPSTMRPTGGMMLLISINQEEVKVTKNALLRDHPSYCSNAGPLSGIGIDE